MYNHDFQSVFRRLSDFRIYLVWRYIKLSSRFLILPIKNFN